MAEVVDAHADRLVPVLEVGPAVTRPSNIISALRETVHGERPTKRAACLYMTGVNGIYKGGEV